jgi:hypothetical protein
MAIQPLQGWGFGCVSSQGGASLTLGFKIKPLWGLGADPAGLRVRLMVIIRLDLFVLRLRAQNGLRIRDAHSASC